MIIVTKNNFLVIFLLKKIRKIVRPFYKNRSKDRYKRLLFEKNVQLFDQEANDYIREQLLLGKPLLISKFGSIELTALCYYKNSLKQKYSFQDYLNFFKGYQPTIWWKDRNGIDDLCRNAGFFPNDQALIGEYYQVNVEAMKQIDILGSYLSMEDAFAKELSHSFCVNLDGYYAPFLFKNPWTSSLKGKKVLVVHPFTEDIEMQYKNNRAFIWKDPEVLPEFELITYRAVQSMLDIKTPYKDWFEALETMKQEINVIDFDIAIVGCGAYGMPLSAYIKTLNKQVIHMASWTQILFGILGTRWDGYDFMKIYFNEYWKRPSKKTVPKDSQLIENGCYW